MEASTVAAEQAEQNGAPVEGAEATHETRHVFAYRQQIDLGEGALECEHREDGKCQDPEHFHAVVVLPNALQHRDVLEKARAARSRRKRSMRDAGSQDRPPSDAYVSLEADLDDLLDHGDRKKVIDEMAEREVRRGSVQRVATVQEDDERWESYWQDREEYERLEGMEEGERPAEEYETLKRTMEDFEKAVEAAIERDRATQVRAFESMTPEQLREQLRTVRIEGEAAESHLNAYYTWMAFIGTRVPPARAGTSRRFFQSLDDYRNAPPEVVEAIENAIRDLESRMQRGEAAGNS